MMLFISQAAAKDGRSILAVMEIEDSSGKFSAKDIQTATEYLRGRLTATGRFIVIDKTRQAAALDRIVAQNKKDSYRECRDTSCQIPLGQELSADSILRTGVLYLGGVFTLQAELVDLSKGAAIKGATVDFEEKPGEAPVRALSGALRSLVTQLAGERPVLAPIQAPAASRPAPPNWARTAGVMGVVGGLGAGALGYFAGETNDPDSADLFPSVPLGAGALVTLLVSVPLVQAGAGSARDEYGVEGIIVARIFGWLGYAATTLTGTALVITGLSEEVPNSLIYGTTALGVGSVGLMTLDAFASANQADALRASEGARAWKSIPRVVLSPVPNERGGSDLLVGLGGRF